MAARVGSGRGGGCTNYPAPRGPGGVGKDSGWNRVPCGFFVTLAALFVTPTTRDPKHSPNTTQLRRNSETNSDASLTIPLRSFSLAPADEDWPEVYGAYSFLLEGVVPEGGVARFHFNSTWREVTDWYTMPFESHNRLDYEKDVAGCKDLFEAVTRTESRFVVELKASAPV
jgi:hypothetical protein